MTTYNSSVKSWTIDPQFNKSKLRSEFRLDRGYPALYTTNMRLLNIGCSVSVADDGTATSRYNYVLGNGAVIRSIYLYDGKRQLDAIVNFQPYCAFKNQLKPNSSQSDSEKGLKHHGLGFAYNRDIQSSGTTLNPAKISEWYPNAPNVPQKDESVTPMGWLDLKAIFPLLQNMQFVHTGIFTDLKVVVEYTTANVVTIVTAPAKQSTVKDTTLPLLVADEILNTELANKVLADFKVVNWSAIESEQVYLPAESTGRNFQLSGANNKTVGRLYIVKSPTTSFSDIYLRATSSAQISEEYQLTINGSNLLPNGGIVSSPNMVLGLLSDTFQNMNCHTGSSDSGFHGASARVVDYSDRCGHLSYFGLLVNQPIIKNIQLNYNRLLRTGGGDQYKQALNINVFYEVAKSIVKTKDGYNVLYVN
jgi:hypothetical protein